MQSPLKTALEDMLRARKLQADSPPLRGEDRRLTALPTGIAAVDALLGGGLPRGQVSEAYGPSSSGRTGLVLSLVARSTGRGALAAWVDPADGLDPASALACGVDLERLLWLRGDPRQPRGRTVSGSLSASGTLLGSGLFEVVVLDLAGIPDFEIRRLPGSTWIRLQRTIETTPTALLLLAGTHVAHGPAGASLTLRLSGARWSGSPGPGRLLRGLTVEARVGRHALRSASFDLRAIA